MKHIRNIIIFIVLQFLLDLAYVYIYPTVNPIRATFIGISALIVLSIGPISHLLKGYVWVGFLAIYSSAFFGALLVEQGTLVSKSPLSAAAHIGILIVTYSVLILIKRSMSPQS